MTNDYKETLLDYVTGNLNIENPKNTDFNIKNINYYLYSDEWSDIRQELLTIGLPYITGVLQNDKYDISIVYGTISPTNDTFNDKGFLIYLDNKLKPIQLITKYKTGNDLKGIHKLYYDSDTNRCYGVIGHCYYNDSTNPNYFAYFNNLFYKNNDNYEIDLRYSYNLSDNNFQCHEIIKDPDGTNYLMLGSNPNSKQNSRAIELKINTGMPNEWTRWSPPNTTATQSIFIGCYGEYSNSNPNFKIITYNNSNQKLGIFYNNGTTSYKNDLFNIKINNITNIYAVLRPLEYQSLNSNEIYFSIPVRSNDGSNNGQLSVLYKYDGTNISEVYRTPIAIAQTSGSIVTYINSYQLNIIKDVDNSLILLQYYANQSENNTNLKILNLTKNMNNITDDKWVNIGNYIYLYPIINNLNQTTFLIRKYNIATICSLNSLISLNSQGYTDGFELVLTNLSPINGYTGDSYTSINSLCPLYSNLYSNGSLIFSRNLYNISKQNNMTMSSVEIPNNYLNDITISQNDLISETNIQMNSDATNWTKNIYEVVDLNFLNTISVIDEDTNKPYLLGAVRVNNSITDINDYQDASCTKIRINYADNTTDIFPIIWEEIDSTHKKTEFSFYVNKAIKSIDFISNDTNTIYCTKQLEVEVGNLYTIKEKIKIGM
ncbi:MAG: hypothetical protein IKE89_03435 [Bacilli bacterium]|nr:hypothetical protein [Bacilli bacterium]MBR2711504.1 hypothetical protein [Bacilli bacterium]